MRFKSKKKSADQTQTVHRFEEVNQIRALAKEDQIDKAIQQFQILLQTTDGSSTNELILLQARLTRVRKNESAGILTWNELEAERNRITQSFLQLVDEVDSRPITHSPIRELSPAESQRRRSYLENIKKDIENRLKVSIHHARLIDLGIDDTPSATHLPWIYRDLNSKQAFENYGEAFDIYERRMLLLGAPGSGKTITLLHIAQQLVSEAEDDETAPIPLLVNLSKFQLSGPQKSMFGFLDRGRSKVETADKRIERWLMSEFTTNPFVSVEMAKTWIEEGRIAALLDGLDEVNDEYRAELVRILNATYLHDYPDAAVVVCSRINEYRPLQDRKETRVALNGAVTLQELTNPQIQEYLNRAQATGLREALLTDEALYQMAQTPLTLSMMTLAYGSARPSEVPSHLSLTERRHHMMDKYVAKMLQRKERRDRGEQFDEQEDNAIPEDDYAYRPDKINSFLGWLAVRMSVRMQTAVSMSGLYSFLSRDIKRDWQSRVWLAIAVSRLPLILVSALLFGIMLAPMSVRAWSLALCLSLIGAALSIPFARSRHHNDNVKQSSVLTFILNQAFIFLLGGVIFVALGMTSIALSSVLPFNIPPVPTAILVICLTIPLFLLLDSFNLESLWYWAFAVATLLFFVAGVIAMRVKGSEYGWFIPAVLVLTFQILVALIVVLRDSQWLTSVALLITLPGVPFLIAFTVRGMRGFQWYFAAAIFIVAAGMIISLTLRPLLPLLGLFFFFTIGSVLAGNHGAVAGGFVYGYLFLLSVFMVDGFGYRFLTRLEDLVELFLDRFSAIADRYLFTPVLKPILAIGRCLPFAGENFFQYTEQALLLKRSAADLEFMHRLLRDYFALRDLQPLLVSADSNRRLEAIRSLGFQGDAAIDALAEFVRQPDPDVREAAAWALGRVVSPIVVPHIEAALNDEAPKVRRSAVLSAKNLIGQEQERLLGMVIDDPDLQVQKALIEVILGSTWLDRTLQERVQSNVEKRIELREFVFSLVGDTSTENAVRSGALRILEDIKDQNSVPYIAEALLDSKFFYRYDAARILGQFDDQRAVRALTKALSDRNRELRKFARQSLERIQARGVLKIKF